MMIMVFIGTFKHESPLGYVSESHGRRLRQRDYLSRPLDGERLTLSLVQVTGTYRFTNLFFERPGSGYFLAFRLFYQARSHGSVSMNYVVPPLFNVHKP